VHFISTSLLTIAEWHWNWLVLYGGVGITLNTSYTKLGADAQTKMQFRGAALAGAAYPLGPGEITGDLMLGVGRAVAGIAESRTTSLTTSIGYRVGL